MFHRSRIASACLALAPLLLPLLLPGPASARETLEEIQRCVSANLPAQTSVQRIELIAEDRGGGRRKMDAQLHWKRFEDGHARVRIRVDAPLDLRGAAYLLIEKDAGEAADMFMYLPAVKKVRRVASGMVGGRLWGTDFSYEDIKQLQGFASAGETERLPDLEIAGRPAHRLSLRTAATEETAYERIVSAIDRETCVTLRVEFYASGDTLRKVLTADPEDLRRLGERWFAGSIEMVDRREETRSFLRVVEIEHDVPVKSTVFSPNSLGRGR